MLLPRGKKEMGRPEVGPGFYPPVMPQLSMPEDPERWGVDPSYYMTHSAEAMAKLTCKGETAKSGNYTTVTKANMENRITPDELVRLQKRLLRTEAMMEKIVSAKKRGSGSSGRRRKSKTSISKKEEKLLKQLRQITQLIQEGRLEAVSPEMEAEEVPYCADWEGYPEETYPEYDEPYKKRGFHTFTLEEPTYQLTAEALAERMEQEEEEIMARKLSIVKEEDEEAQEEEEDEEEDEEDEDKEEEVEEVEEEIEEEEEEEEEEEAEEEEGEGEEEEEEEEAEKAEKILLLSLPSFQPVAERKQERLGLQLSKELQCLNGGKKQISFSDHKDVFHYPKEGTYEEEEEEKQEEVGEEDEGTEGEEEEEEDEEDPVMEAESLQFSCEGCPNPEEEAEEDKEDYLLVLEPVEEDSPIHADRPKEVGASGLRMRNRRET